MKAILYYVHDPMCSWCWGFTNTLNELLANLPEDIDVQRLLGGLASDTDLAMRESMQQQIKSNWSHIEDTIPGVKFNFDFWEKAIPRRSTYPACRAVIAARKQGSEYDLKMTKAIQRAYYNEAQNPSDNSTLIALAEELDLLVSDFEKDLSSQETQDKLTKEINMARELYVNSFPSLVLEVDSEVHIIQLNYNDSQLMLNEINNIIQSK